MTTDQGELQLVAEVVSDDLRGNSSPLGLRDTKYQPMLDLLMEGKTLEARNRKSNYVNGMLSKKLKLRGYRLRTHEVPEGTIFWAEKWEAPDSVRKQDWEAYAQGREAPATNE
jgi:hypothetical protein